MCPHQDVVHEWKECPYAHPGEKANRRNPLTHSYMPIPCPDYRKGVCKRGDPCPWAHGVFECWLHPLKFRTLLCRDGAACHRRMCFFAHSTDELRFPPSLELALTGGGAQASPCDILQHNSMIAGGSLSSLLSSTSTSPIPILQGVHDVVPPTPPAIVAQIHPVTPSDVLAIGAPQTASTWTPMGSVSCPWPPTPLATAATPSSSMSVASLSRTDSTLETYTPDPADPATMVASLGRGGVYAATVGAAGGASIPRSYSSSVFPTAGSGLLGGGSGGEQYLQQHMQQQHAQQQQQRSLQQLLQHLHTSSSSPLSSSLQPGGWSVERGVHNADAAQGRGWGW